MTHRWFTGQIDTIAMLMREGKSLGQIAKIFEVSRGAVAGVVHRTEKLKEIGFKELPPFIRSVDSTGRAVIRNRLREEQGVDKEIIGLATVRKEKTLMELTSTMCRFPIWQHNGHPVEFLFCAEARVEDSSYCAAHQKLCHAQSRPYQPQPKGLDPKEQNR